MLGRFSAKEAQGVGSVCEEVTMGFDDRMRARVPISLLLLPIVGAATIDQIFTTLDSNALAE